MFSTMTTNVTKPVINSMKKNNYVNNYNEVNIDILLIILQQFENNYNYHAHTCVIDIPVYQSTETPSLVFNRHVV